MRAAVSSSVTLMRSAARRRPDPTTPRARAGCRRAAGRRAGTPWSPAGGGTAWSASRLTTRIDPVAPDSRSVRAQRDGGDAAADDQVVHGPIGHARAPLHQQPGDSLAPLSRQITRRELLGCVAARLRCWRWRCTGRCRCTWGATSPRTPATRSSRRGRWRGTATRWLHHPLSLFQANTFWPLRDSLAFSDALVGYAPGRADRPRGLRRGGPLRRPVPVRLRAVLRRRLAAGARARRRARRRGGAGRGVRLLPVPPRAGRPPARALQRRDPAGAVPAHPRLPARLDRG